MKDNQNAKGSIKCHSGAISKASSSNAQNREINNLLKDSDSMVQ